MGKQRRGRGGSANQGGGTRAPQGGYAGRGNQAANVYAGVRPGQARLEQGNAIIIVIAGKSGRELDRWQGPMQWPPDGETLPVMFMGQRAGEEWAWSDARGDDICLDSETPTGCGIAIEPWADQRGATEEVLGIIRELMDDSPVLQGRPFIHYRAKP
jgi:hypothetical protein